MNGRPGRADLLASLWLGVLVSVCYAPELLGFRSLFFFDVSSLNLPARDWGFRQIASGHFPEWCPHWYLGFPFIAESQSGIYYPPNYVFFLIFPSWYATTLAYCCHLFLAGVGAYFLFRRRASVQGAWLGASAFALGGRLLEHQIHEAVVETIAWLPLVILGCVRFIEDGNRRALWWAALAAGVQALAGSLQSVVICHFAAAIYLASMTLGNRRAFRRAVGAILGVGVFAVGISAALLVPTFELFLQSQRTGAGVSEWANFGAISPLRWVQFILPGAFGNPAYDTAWLDDRDPVFETGLYHGGAVLVLALVGMFAGGTRRRSAFVGTAMVVVGLSLAAGEMHLLGAGLRRLPVFSSIRVPARFLLLVGFGFCLLASLGWDELVERGRRARIRLTMTTAFLFAASVAALFWLYGKLLGNLPPHIVPAQLNLFVERVLAGMRDGDLLRLASVIGAVAACFFVERNAKIAFIVVAACCSIDWCWSARVKSPTIEPSFHSRPSTADALVELCKPDPPRVFVHWLANTQRGVDLNRPGWRRSMEPYQKIGDWLYYERGPLFDVGVFPDVGYLPLQTKTLAEFRGAFQFDPERFMRMCGVSIAMSAEPRGKGETVHRAKGCVLERIPDSVPYTFFSPSFRRVPSTEMMEQLKPERHEPGFEVVLEGPHQPSSSPPSKWTAAVPRWDGPNRLSVTVDAPSQGWVLIHEMHDAGWKANVDGAGVPIERANGLFMAVPVEAGSHQIVFTYAPASVRLGRWISLAAFVLWTALGVKWASVRKAAVEIDGRTPSVSWMLLGFALLFAASWFLLTDQWAGAFPSIIPPP